MLPTRSPIYLPPTTRRPTINTIKPTTRIPIINTVKPTTTTRNPTIKPTTGNPTGDSVLSSLNPSFRPSFRPSIVPVGLLTDSPSVQTASGEPTQVNLIGSYSIVQNSEEFIPVKIQYAVVGISGCFFMAMILFCCLFFKKRKRERQENTRVIDIFQPSLIEDKILSVSSKTQPQEHIQTQPYPYQQLQKQQSLEQLPPPPPPPRSQLVKSHSLPIPPSRLPPQPPPRKTMSYYKD